MCICQCQGPGQNPGKQGLVGHAALPEQMYKQVPVRMLSQKRGQDPGKNRPRAGHRVDVKVNS